MYVILPMPAPLRQTGTRLVARSAQVEWLAVQGQIRSLHHISIPTLLQRTNVNYPLTSHHDKEERHVRRLAHAIAIQVDSGTQLVAKTAGVEWLAVQGQSPSIHCISLPTLVVANFPNKGAIVGGRFQQLEAKVHFCHADVVHTQLSVMCG